MEYNIDFQWKRSEIVREETPIPYPISFKNAYVIQSNIQENQIVGSGNERYPYEVTASSTKVYGSHINRFSMICIGK